MLHVPGDSEKTDEERAQLVNGDAATVVDPARLRAVELEEDGLPSVAELEGAPNFIGFVERKAYDVANSCLLDGFT